MHLGRKLLAIATAAAVTAPLTISPAASAARRSTLATRAEKKLGMHCSTQTSADGVKFTKCSGEIPSYDGIGLDTDLSIPLGARRARPTILMLHGWSGDKTNWEANSRKGSGADNWHWNNVWFASRGWVAINYTARGFKDSCGTSDHDANCSKGYTHLASRHAETRDSKVILGKLVDAGIANRRKLASTGGSYGGGQTLLLATSFPWKSPGGQSLQLRAAVAKYPWSDLLDSLGPNGRATSARDQHRSHLNPFGVPKQSYVDGLYATGRSVGQGRYDDDPNHPGTNLDQQYAEVQKGEPYDQSDPRLRAMVHSFFARSPYYAKKFFAAIHGGAVRPVPIFSISGYTDPLFPPVQTLQLFRKLKAADPHYPFTMAFGDVGHNNAGNPPAQWHPINRLGNRFLDARLLGHRAELPGAQAYSFRTRCSGAGKRQSAVAGLWGSLARGVATAQGAGSEQTASADPNPGDGPASDPLTRTGCIKESSGTKDPGGAYWSWHQGGITLLGLPTFKAHYSLSGNDAVVAFKLWDVAKDGSKTLVTRGGYRLSRASGDPAKGKLITQLFGNHYRFPAGDKIELQVTQNDSPYLRADNLPSTIDWSSVRLLLPTKQGGTRTLKPA